MARPKNKSDLISLGQENYKRLNELVDSYSAKEQESDFPPGTLNRNIRDVLAHLHHWHLMFLGWYEAGMKGEKPEMPAKGYSWKTTPDLNLEIRKRYTGTPLYEVRKTLETSFHDVQNIIASHSNEELFTKKRYKWTGSTSLGAYLVSATSSHYDWAIKLIKRVKR